MVEKDCASEAIGSLNRLKIDLLRFRISRRTPNHTKIKESMSQAFLMVLLGVTAIGGIEVVSVHITNNENLACDLQKQTYACVEKVSGATYHEAREALIKSIAHRANLSQPNSLWQSIYNLVSD